MEVNTEALKAYYEELKSKKEMEINQALANKDVLVAQKIEELRPQVAEQIEKDIIAEVEEKYAHDIELCEKFLIEEKVEEVQEVEQTADVQIAVEG